LVPVINIHEAKTHSSRLIEQAVRGETVVIAKSGTPVVRIVKFEAPAPRAVRRLGFLAGQGAVPEDFDTMGAPEIEAMCGGQ
jgi:prevent-host-death family protein